MADAPFPELIGVALWTRADWQSVVYGSRSAVKPPFLALGFANSEAAKQIFRNLQSVTSPIDTFELIRIAIIEGDIPGEPPGYTVHISPHFDGIVAKTRAEGKQPPDVMIVSQIHRMRPAPGYPVLGWFKQELAKNGRYFLMGASVSPSGTDPVIDRDIAIEKKLIIFKDVTQIGPDDDDHVIFAREMRRRPH